MMYCFVCLGLFFNDNLIKIISFFYMSHMCASHLILICGILKDGLASDFVVWDKKIMTLSFT